MNLELKEILSTYSLCCRCSLISSSSASKSTCKSLRRLLSKHIIILSGSCRCSLILSLLRSIYFRWSFFFFIRIFYVRLSKFFFNCLSNPTSKSDWSSLSSFTIAIISVNRDIKQTLWCYLRYICLTASTYYWIWMIMFRIGPRHMSRSLSTWSIILLYLFTE
jgi:hypothetical protein